MNKTIFTTWAIAAFAASTEACADPLTDFKSLVARCHSVFDAKPSPEVVLMKASNKWVHRVRAPVKISFDVRKTDSIVSPFTGVMEIKTLVAAISADDEQSAASLMPALSQKNAYLSVQTLNFAYRGEQEIWEVTGGSGVSQLRVADGGDDFDRDTKTTSTKEFLLKYMSPNKACLNLD